MILVIEGDRPVQAIGQTQLQVVLQVLADFGSIDEGRDPHFLQVRGWPDAREHQQLWGVDRAATDDHFALGAHVPHLAVLFVAHSGGSVLLEADAADHRVGDDREIGSLLGGSQVTDRGTAAATVADRGLVVADAFLLGAVEVVVAWNAQSLGGGDEARPDFAAVGAVRHRQGAADRVVRVSPPGLVLDLQEIGK